LSVILDDGDVDDEFCPTDKADAPTVVCESAHGKPSGEEDPTAMA